MVNFTIRAAGFTAAVRANYETTRLFCEDYLWEGEQDYSVEITAADIAYERAERADRGLEESEAYLEITALLRKISENLPAYGALMFHGSAVAVDGVCYLFTAPSGTGKSTHTRLWRQLLGQRAVMVNDDKPFLRIGEEEILVCGSPWTGKHRLGANISVPLKAVCILKRGEENSIQPITPREALVALLQQSARPRDSKLVGRYMELLDRMAKQVTFYRLFCTESLNAARLSYQTMAVGTPVPENPQKEK